MKVTVCVCTWNRAKLLDLTLGRMVSLRIPSGMTWELLVVNNNSTDHTESVLESYKKRLPLRVLFEASPGLSNARNRAIVEVQGDLIVWTDDDVLVDTEWLAAFAEAADRWPAASFFGGPIEPWFEGEPSSWLRQVYPKVQTAFATRDLGKAQFILNENALPFGANFAIRTAAQRRYLYNAKLGRRPASKLTEPQPSTL